MQTHSEFAIAIFFLSLAAGITSANFVMAASSSDILIDEIAWMGTIISANDEWIELYNNTSSSVDLNGWNLNASDESPLINLTGAIPAHGFYLLERTDDNSLPDLPADQIYTGALGNSGEFLKLTDSSGSLIDQADFSAGWTAGDNITKQTMERKDLSSWQTSQNPGGTPKSQNNILSEQKVIISAKEYPSGIIINELMPSPLGLDTQEEWIELFNQNSFTVDLALWQITDTIGKTSSYIFPEGTTLAGFSYLILPSSMTKISLNNSGDGLTLSQPDGKIVNVVNYDQAPRGQSFSKESAVWIWSKTPTPGEKNIAVVINEEPEKTEKSTSSESLPQDNNRPLPFLTASLIALFSGTSIIILKKKIKIC
jgi:hypothetical protein